jgi:hypothetical protein
MRRDDDDDRFTIDERERERMRRRDRRRRTDMVIDGGNIRDIVQSLARPGKRPRRGEWK